jgi:aryl-alcohol dehydrogenase-like predicted oxidoreductase
LGSIPADRAGRFLKPEWLAAATRLTAYAADHGRTLLDLAFAYLLASGPVASVIAGATRPEQVAANAAAAGWHLDPGQQDEVRQIATTE